MADKEQGRWVTIKGNKIHIEDNESVQDAIKKHFGEDISLKKRINKGNYEYSVDKGKIYEALSKALYNELDAEEDDMDLTVDDDITQKDYHWEEADNGVPNHIQIDKDNEHKNERYDDDLDYKNSLKNKEDEEKAALEADTELRKAATEYLMEELNLPEHSFDDEWWNNLTSEDKEKLSKMIEKHKQKKEEQEKLKKERDTKVQELLDSALDED